MLRLTETELASVDGIMTLFGVVVAVVLVLGALGGFFWWLRNKRGNEV